jgi:hypothetical protein
VKKPGASYAGDEAVKQYVATQANAFFSPGEEIVQERLSAFVIACKGVKDVAEIKLGLTAHPSESDNIPVSIRQIGRFSTSRITIIAA